MVAFSSDSYNTFDKAGKDAVIGFFERNGYTYNQSDEDRGIDLMFTLEGFPPIYVEAAVRSKFQWQLTEWKEKSPWRTVHILERKMKYGLPPPMGYGDSAFLFEINHNLTQAFVIQPSKITVKKTQIKTPRGYEWMRDVPYKHFKIINL